MKKGEQILAENVIYVIILVLALLIMFLHIKQQSNGAALWEDYYTKEISRIINLASPGEEIALDVHKATEIAQKNNIPSFSEIFSFDNKENEVCVKLSTGKKTCYKYFNEIDVIEPGLQLASGSEGETNILTFKITEVQKDE